jgi:hypothetical protein
MRARAGLAADADSLVRALLAYDRDRADHAIETALAVRSVEGSVEEVLLPSLDVIVRRHGAAYLRPWEDGTVVQVTVQERPPLVGHTPGANAAKDMRHIVGHNEDGLLVAGSSAARGAKCSA